MKRLVCYLLIISSIFCLLACGEVEMDASANFYYVRKEYVYGQEDGVIAAEKRKLTELSDIRGILNTYLSGPQDPLLELPFAPNTEIIRFSQEDDTLYITLSSHIITLSKAKQVLACTCLARTVIELSEVEKVYFETDNNAVARMDPISITKDSYLLFDDYNSTNPTDMDE